MAILTVVWYIVIAIIAFSIIIVAHEFGHFIMAKLSGIKVEEFAIGMGPKLVGKRYGETLFSIRALPIGGMCQMLGEDESNENPRAFNNKPVLSRIAVVAFGPIMNMVYAVLIFSFLIAQVPMIEKVVPGMPAEKAGITAGEKIIAINNMEITKMEQVNQIISSNDGKNIVLKLQKDGNTREVKVTPAMDAANKRPIIGIEMSFGLRIYGFSLPEGARYTANLTNEMLKVFGMLFRGKVSSNDIAGPVGIVYIMSKAAKAGFVNVMFFTGVLSLNLAIINLLPFPALDGGRLIFLILELIRRKPVNQEKEGLVHFVGFVILIALSILLIFKDVINLPHMGF